MATITVPARFMDTDWAAQIIWDDIDPHLYDAIEWTMNSIVLNFYCPSYDEDSTALGYPDIDTALDAAAILFYSDVEGDVVERLSSVYEIGELDYLKSEPVVEGGTFSQPPAELLAEEWAASSPR